MFDSLHSKLEAAFKRIRGKGVISKGDIEATFKVVRMALLEADVNYKVAKGFCDSVAAKALGTDVLKSLTPDQQIIKLVQEELVAIMGGGTAELNLRVAPPAVILLIGLQGSGKTTTVAKLGRVLKMQYRRKPLLIAADVYRPAAVEQLNLLGQQLDITVFSIPGSNNPVEIAREGRAYAAQRDFDVIIVDTAGRLQIDHELMDELEEICQAIEPHETLLVADAMTGQEAVNVAKGFQEKLRIDGLILTKLDGDARGGAALSMRAVTGCPIKFIGVGEKTDGLEVFHPERLASRILGMGDVLSLIEKASAQIDLDQSIDLQRKIKKNQFDLEDFLGQMRMIKKMGSVTSLAAMIPGMGKVMKQVDPEQAEGELKKVEAIILSMTPKERRNHGIINGSRRKRIANGSGTRVEDVNRLLKQFTEMKKMFGKISKMGMGGLMGMLGGRSGAALLGR